MQLKDVCTVFSGYAFKNFNDEKLGKPIIKIGNITPNFEIDTFDCQYTLEKPNEKYLSKKDDIYIALSGATTGKIGLMKKEGYFINQRVGIVRPINKDIPIEYLYYFLQSKTLKILDDAAGAAQPNISPKDISNYIFKTYDKVQMNNIVAVLSDLTKSVKQKKCEFDHLNELIKSRFIEQFSNCEKIELSSIANITMGQSPDSSSYNDDRLGMPFFQGKGDYGEKYTIVKHFTTSPKKIAKRNSVLMSVRAPVGPVNIANIDCCIGRGLCSINGKENLTNNEFLYNALNAMQDEISSKGNGSTFNAINKDDVLNLKIPKATIEEQVEFSNFAQQIDKLKFIVQKEINDLQELLDKKMQEYFGE